MPETVRSRHHQRDGAQWVGPTGQKRIAFTEEGEEEALLLLDRYGLDITNGSPLTLREIRWAVSQLPDLDREELIRDLLNSEFAKAETETGE